MDHGIAIFNLALAKLEPTFKKWVREVIRETHQTNLPELSEQLLTPPEAADFLKLTLPTIYSKVSRGELPVMKQGKRLYFSNIQLMEYLKQGQKKTNAELDAEAKAYLKGGRK